MWSKRATWNLVGTRGFVSGANKKPIFRKMQTIYKETKEHKTEADSWEHKY